jgi:DedD protein
MGLFSFLKRDDAAEAAAPKKPARSGAKTTAADDVQVLRVRARRRLIGAAVLVAAGVVGFPLIFETQPRPIPVDLPIEIPRKDQVPPLAVPAREPLAPPTETATAPSSGPAAAAVETPAPAVAVAERPVEKPAETPVERPVEKPPVRVAEKAAEKPADKPADKPRAGSSQDGARAQALLEGRDPAAAPAAARYIVQVGAYGENRAAQEMRAKVEKLGLKTYAQAVDTADGRRVRVRLGPYASRDEAERAAAKLKGAGLPGAILTL